MLCRMKAPLLLAACLALTWQLGVAAEPTRTPPRLLAPPAPPEWLADANGCRFLNPEARANQPAVTIEWNGACVDGFVDGPGVLTAGYMVYRGEFARGRIVKGTAAGGGFAFEGTFADNAPNGEMVVRMPDGTTVKGTFDHGSIDPAHAEITWPNGAHYRGAVERTFLKMHGQGVLEYGDGSVYEGEFRQDRVEGAGVMKRPNGEIRRGTFVDGRQEGRGSVLYANQARYEGELRADQPSGQVGSSLPTVRFTKARSWAAAIRGKASCTTLTAVSTKARFWPAIRRAAAR